MTREFDPSSIRDAVAHGFAGRGEIDIVDAQVHLAPAPTLDALTSALNALGIAAVMFDELWGRDEQGRSTPSIELGDDAYRPFSPLAQAAALQNPRRFSYVQRVTRRDPSVSRFIADRAALPGCRAVRIVLQDRHERASFVDGEYDDILSGAQRALLPVMVLSRDCGALLSGAAGRFPLLNFIADHCGWIKTVGQWEDVLALGRFPNVYLKWSHAYRAFGRPERADTDVQHAFERALNAFGPPRMLWASDITHEESLSSWAELLAFVLLNPALSDDGREAVLAKTARRIFNWPL